MIAKGTIETTIDQLDLLFNKATTNKQTALYSKMAILEVCGWIETAMDIIATKAMAKHLHEIKNQEAIKTIIRNTYGFDYNGNFRKMIIKIIGYSGIEKIESKLDKTKFSNLLSELKVLKESRDAHAHTYLIIRATLHIDSPSKTKARFKSVYEGLIEFDNHLKSIRIVKNS
jgi:hypothetical protein